MSAGRPLLEVEGLRVAYGGVVAVHDVSLRVNEGETVVLLGANGAGKTTTLRAISGLEVPAAGAVRVDGEDVTGAPPASIARRGVAHVPSHRGLFGRLTVEENLRMGLYGAGLDRGARGDGARDGAGRDRRGPVMGLDEVYRLFPMLAESARALAGTLSGGQQQMLAVGRALVQSPRLLMLDEMSMGLAPIVVADLFAQITSLKERGVTLLVVEQFVEQALAVADAAVLVEQGRVVYSGPPQELLAGAVAEAYLGREMGEVEVAAPAVTARETIEVALDARALRELEARAGPGRSPGEIAGEFVAERLGGPPNGGRGRRARGRR